MDNAMQPKRLSPLEILQKQKTDLQAKADVLSDNIENRVNYLQKNFTPLLFNSIVESATSKLPPQLQNLAGKFIQKEPKSADTQNATNSTVSKLISGIVIGIAVVVPIIISNKKGKIISFLMKQILRMIRI